MALDQHVISRVFLVGLFRNTVNKDVDFFFRGKLLLILSKFPPCLHALSTLSIIKFKKNEMKYSSIFFLQDGIEKSTPAPVGPHHCFLLITESVLLFHAIVCFPAWKN